MQALCKSPRCFLSASSCERFPLFSTWYRLYSSPVFFCVSSSTESLFSQSSISLSLCCFSPDILSRVPSIKVMDNSLKSSGSLFISSAFSSCLFSASTLSASFWLFKLLCCSLSFISSFSITLHSRSSFSIEDWSSFITSSPDSAPAPPKWTAGLGCAVAPHTGQGSLSLSFFASTNALFLSCSFFFSSIKAFILSSSCCFSPFFVQSSLILFSSTSS